MHTCTRACIFSCIHIHNLMHASMDFFHYRSKRSCFICVSSFRNISFDITLHFYKRLCDVFLPASLLVHGKLCSVISMEKQNHLLESFATEYKHDRITTSLLPLWSCGKACTFRVEGRGVGAGEGCVCVCVCVCVCGGGDLGIAPAFTDQILILTSKLALWCLPYQSIPVGIVSVSGTG